MIISKMNNSLQRFLTILVVLSIVLFAFLLIGLRPSYAAEIVDSGKCGDNLTWTLDSEGLLTISGTGEMSSFSPYDSPWYSNEDNVSTVRIESGVTSIGEFAFDSCSSLTSITIPDSVTSIGMCAFSCCTNLTSITLPDGVTSIGNEAFYCCDHLTYIYIPNSVTSIGEGAFKQCFSLTNMMLPDGVTSIRVDTFCDCSRLANINIPNSVTSIGEGAFAYCSRLTSITLPDGVTSIGNDAFYNCDHLTYIYIPNSVTSIGEGAFSVCASLSEVHYGGSQASWESIAIGDNNTGLQNATIYYNTPEPYSDVVTVGGIIREEDGWKITWKVEYFDQEDKQAKLMIEAEGAEDGYSGGHVITDDVMSEMTMPWLTEEYGFAKTDFVEISINGNSNNYLIPIINQFRNYTNVRTLTLDYVEYIMSGAFQGCTGLTEVNVGYGIKTIDNYAFSNTAVTDFDFSGVKKIGKEAFKGSALEDVTIGSSVVEIGTDAFADCEKIVIHCYSGSEAFDYAVRESIPYVLIDGSVYPENKELPSDVCVYEDHFSDRNPYNGAAFYAFKASDVNVQTYADAVTYCKSRGGHLATFDDSKKLEDYVTQYLTNMNIKQRVYIGLSCANVDEQNWKWVDGAQLDEVRWAEGEPSMNKKERYAALHWSAIPELYTGWEDATFTEDDKYFLCQWDAPAPYYNTFRMKDDGNAFGHTRSHFYNKLLFNKNTSFFQEVKAQAESDDFAVPAFVNSSAFACAQMDYQSQGNRDSEKLWKTSVNGETLYGRAEDAKYQTAYFNTLVKGVGLFERSDLDFKRNREWKGSCFGIEAVLVLAKEGYFDKQFSYTKIPDMGYPVQNRYGFRDMINYYQLKQSRWDVKADREVKKEESAWDQKEFNRALVKEAKYAANNDKSFLITYFYDRTDAETNKKTESGHAVVVCGYSFDGENHCLKIFNCNEHKSWYQYLYISKDYSTRSFTGKSGIKEIKYYGVNKILSWANDLTGSRSAKAAEVEEETQEKDSIQELSEVDGRSVISFAANTTFTVSNDKGQSIDVSGGDIEGDLAVYGDSKAVKNESESVDVTLVVDDSSTYTISNIGKTDEDSPFQFSASTDDNKEYCGIVCDGASQIQLSDEDGISLQGDAYTFTVTQSLSDGDALCSVSGTAEGEVKADAKEDTVTVSGEKQIRDITVGNYGSNGAMSEYSVADGSEISVPAKSEAEVDKELSVEKANLSGLTTKTYTGKAQTQFLQVTMENNGTGKTLVEDVDYTVSYSNNINAGNDAKVTITGIGDYSGTLTKSFTIKPKAVTPTLTLSKKEFVYNGKTQKPAVVVKSNGTKLPASGYTVTYASGCKNVGTYKVTVRLKGNYTGTASKSFTIKPKGTTISKVSATKKGFKVKWKKGTGISGYEIQYALNKKFTKGKKLAKITKQATVSKKVTKLKAKKKYFVRIRTYTIVRGKKYYSAWSSVKTVVAKK